MKKKLPLEGITVVELGTYIAVPNATRFMADWGATVIKVENINGEQWRKLGKLYNTPTDEEENPLFAVQNANKKFISIDLKTSKGLRLIKELISKSDVFISNIRINSLKKMNLDYESIKKINDTIIYFHFTGFGYEGSDSSRPGFDLAAYWARSGAMIDWGDIGDYPIKPTGGFGDATVSCNILSGILAALYARSKSGNGTFLTSSLYASAIWFNSTAIVSAQEKYGNIYPKNKNKPINPLSHIYKCKDGEYLCLTVLNYDKEIDKISTILGISEYIITNKYNKLLHVQENIEHYMEVINEAFLKKTSTEWCEIFIKEDVVYERLAHMKDVSLDSQALINGYLKEVTFPNNSKAIMPTVPIFFSEYEVDQYDSDTRLGKDTLSLLKSLGYTEHQYYELMNEHVIR